MRSYTIPSLLLLLLALVGTGCWATPTYKVASCRVGYVAIVAVDGQSQIVSGLPFLIRGERLTSLLCLTLVVAVRPSILDLEHDQVQAMPDLRYDHHVRPFRFFSNSFEDDFSNFLASLTRSSSHQDRPSNEQDLC